MLPENNPIGSTMVYMCKKDIWGGSKTVGIARDSQDHRAFALQHEFPVAFLNTWMTRVEDMFWTLK